MGPSTIHLVSAQLFLFLFHLGSDSLSGIPDIKADYVEVKGMFVKVCTTQGTPTLDEVKDHCIDLLESLPDRPEISHHSDDIERAMTMNQLARVVCFRLSNWVSYDFFKKVIAHFQPALKHVNEKLMLYENELKLFLQSKLEHISELLSRWV